MRLDGASHIKDGVLKGTWVPMTFARNLVKGRSISQELAKFLEDMEITEFSPPTVQSSAIPLLLEEFRPVQRNSDADTPLLLPAFEPKPETGSSDIRQFKLPIRRHPVYDENPVWQREEFTNWNLNMDLDPSLTFPPLPHIVRTNLQSECVTLQSSDSPLSPQEEEIFHSLVDLGLDKPTERERVNQPEENVLEADDEQESPSQLRRSKRVAARSGTTRTKSKSLGTRRSTRTV